MVIARYPLFLLMMFALTACGNVFMHEGDANAHESKSTTAGPSSESGESILDLNQATNIKALIPTLIKNRVIFIGETHDNYSHHNAQLEIITALKDTGADLAIGMEMFQRPFQQPLDDFISGELSAAEMLRKTEWYDRWVYDYRLYRPILSYAKAHGIPLIALNTPREITRQVSIQGLDSLDAQQRSEIPADIDFSDAVYSERLKEIFKQHGEKDDRNFERFLQVQLLWDEGMAERAAIYLNNHPTKLLVILAGSGHLMHGSGIPQRVTRRVPVSSAIVLPGGDLRVVPGIADYVIFPRPITLPPAALMGIYMEPSSEGVMVSDIAKGGAAEKSGIQSKDIILALDGEKVTSPGDVRIALLEKQPGDKISVGFVRKGVLFGQKNLTTELTLGE